MRERHQPRVVNGGDQNAGRDPDRLLRVVVLDLPAIRQQAVALGEDDDQKRRVFDKRLVLVGAKWCERIKPFLWRLVVIKLVLLSLGLDADPLLDRGIRYDDEVPRLHVGAAGGRPCGAQAMSDDVARHRASVEVADGAALLHDVAERRRPLLHDIDWIFLIIRKSDKSWFRHGMEVGSKGPAVARVHG